VLETMRILRARDRVPSPWKNGGGTTTEVAIFPPGAGLENFGWRVSIARVERGGPFSLFPGIDRQLALLEGRLSLTIAGRTVALSADSEPIGFPGDVATEAAILEGPVTDLNVMTRRGASTARMTRRRGAIAFDTSDAVTIAFPLAPVIVHGEKIPLVMGDAIFAEPGSSRMIQISPDTDFFRIEIFPAGHFSDQIQDGTTA
jgi:environmental stress-induced protein Ves